MRMWYVCCSPILSKDRLPHGTFPDSGSMNSWDEFEKLFLQNFGDDNTPEDLVIDLSYLRIKGKERVKEFN